MVKVLMAVVLGILRAVLAKKTPSVITYRDAQGPAAVVFVHGFAGDLAGTWGAFPSFVCDSGDAKTWDVFSIGYPTNLRIDIPRVWAADPNLTTLAAGLRTLLSLPPFARYAAITVCAHSMGGLVLQQAILDDAALASRISFVFLFGTPSAGLAKATLVRHLKRQLGDMADDECVH